MASNPVYELTEAMPSIAAALIAANIERAIRANLVQYNISCAMRWFDEKASFKSE